MNSIVLKGNLGANPEIKKVGKNNNSLATFNLAHSEYKGKQDNGESRYETFWVKVVAWGRLAEALSHLKKGDQVIVMGRLSIREWEDDKGQKRFSTEIIAYSVNKLERVKRAEAEEAHSGSTESEPLFGSDQD